jgi:hypothetical protein
MIKYITNKYNSIKLQYDEGMLAWLKETYPFSEYRIVEVLHERKS